MIGGANKTVKPMPRLTLGYLELSQDEYDWLQAITRMNEDSPEVVYYPSLERASLPSQSSLHEKASIPLRTTRVNY
jgi:hypothetical protein